MHAMNADRDFDVLIIGAGLSGIGSACHLAREFPQLRVALLERRRDLGGTWDLFRYPGVRSDSDMGSFGYDFRPWNEARMLADGPSIREYIRATAQDYGVDRKVRYGLRVRRAEWSSSVGRWTVTAVGEADGQQQNYTGTYIVGCSGYYDYDAGHLPAFPGQENFAGLRIHPQQWPHDFDYADKRIVVIGSGATAVTLVPALAAKAEHVIMLQRSPSYYYSLPLVDHFVEGLARRLPARWVYAQARRRNILIGRLLYVACRRYPSLMRRFLLAQVRKQVGPNVDMRHFTPRYQPWDERLCIVPNSDLFRAIRSGRASVETDTIATFTKDGIRLTSGKELAADVIVTATGLELQMLGGAELVVDGRPQEAREKLIYKGVLIQDIPNFVWVFGYTNAAWTLKADLSGRYFCRLLRYMGDNGRQGFVARDRNNSATQESIMDSLQSGYVRRNHERIPRQGKALPWRVLTDYAHDRKVLLGDPVDDGILEWLQAPHERSPSSDSATAGGPLTVSA